MPAAPGPFSTTFMSSSLPAGDVGGVDKARRHDDGGAMLVVMKDGNVHHLAQLLLDDETVGRLDVFQIDAAEAGAQIAHGIDEGVHVGGIDFQIDGIDIGETLEQHRLAFHHRLGGGGAQIAQAQDGGAVGDHRDHVAAVGIVEHRIGVFRDGAHRHRHARRIGQAEVALGRHRLGRGDFQLAGLGAGVKGKGFFVGEGGAVVGGHGTRLSFSNPQIIGRACHAAVGRWGTSLIGFSP